MPRTAFLFTPENRGLLERRFDADDFETLGRVEGARYLRVVDPSALARAFAFLLGPARSRLTLRPPFDDGGDDVHALVDPSAERLDGHDDPIGAIRIASGTVTCLPPREPGDDVVLRDLWSLDPALRVLDGTQFAITTHDGEPIVVAFARAPLVVAPPVTRELDEHRAAIRASPACRDALLRASDGVGAARVVEIREGDTVDVLGLTWLPDDAERRFDLRGRTAGYRSAPRPLRLVIADAPGVRIVVRLVRRGAGPVR